MRATNDSNVLIAMGSAKFGDLEYMIVSNAMVEDIDELNDIPVAMRDGRPIFVRDIGHDLPPDPWLANSCATAGWGRAGAKAGDASVSRTRTKRKAGAR